MSLDSLIDPDFPVHSLGPLRCYADDFSKQKALWALQTRHLFFHLEYFIWDLKQQAKAPGLMRTTRDRLKAVVSAKSEHLDELKRLLTPLGGESVPVQDYQNYLNQIGAKNSELVDYLVNLHRDWAWQTTEVQSAFDTLRGLIPPGARLGKLLAPGAGACRLPYEVHRAFQPELTVVTDINPLLLLAAQKIISGSPLKLHEFPPLPVDANSVFALRELKAETPIRENFHFVLNDMNENCFREAAFDTILTSWFIDVVPIDIHQLFPLINRLLKPGGLWLNFGPLMFKSPFPRMYTREETLAMARKSGFEVEAENWNFVPHLHSPIDSYRSTVGVLSFRAVKTAEAEFMPSPDDPSQALPAWCTNPELPVELGVDHRPLAAHHMVMSETLAVADGSRSMNEIAAHISARFGLDAGLARAMCERSLRSIAESFQANPLLSAKR